MTAQQIIEAIYAEQPLVYGHRGAKAYAPMNTLPAFELAAEQGAHGIELDVQRSRDGFPVVVHDFTVDATSDGSGAVAALSLAELKALDAGGWFAPRFAGTRIPTLDEVFEAVGRRLFVNVEIKAPGPETDGVEEVVAACIRRHAMERRVIVSSFSLPALRRFRGLMPAVPIGYLFYEQRDPSFEDHAFEAFHPYHRLVDAPLIELSRRSGKVINVWTVNDPAQAAALCALGVHGIITDAPDMVLRALGRS